MRERNGRENKTQTREHDKYEINEPTVFCGCHRIMKAIY